MLYIRTSISNAKPASDEYADVRKASEGNHNMFGLPVL